MNPEDRLWDYPDPHILRVRIQPGDIDGLYHTNNTVYVDWCQKVAWAHSVSLGLDLERYRELDRAMVITRSEFDYLQPSREGDEVLVGIAVGTQTPASAVAAVAPPAAAPAAPLIPPPTPPKEEAKPEPKAEVPPPTPTPAETKEAATTGPTSGTASSCSSSAARKAAKSWKNSARLRAVDSPTSWIPRA